jgi:hypothetical protein
MTRTFIPPMGRVKRRLIAEAYASWLPDLEADWWLTLNFNRPVTLAGVRNQFAGWLARIDSEYLGRNWCRCSAEKRAFAFAVVEHPRSNIHLHALLRMPIPARALRRPYQSESMKKHWRKLEPGG